MKLAGSDVILKGLTPNVRQCSKVIKTVCHWMDCCFQFFLGGDLDLTLTTTFPKKT